MSRIGLSKIYIECMVFGKRSQRSQQIMWHDNIINVHLGNVYVDSKDGEFWGDLSHINGHSDRGGEGVSE